MENNSFSNAIIHFKWITEINLFRLALHSTERWFVIKSIRSLFVGAMGIGRWSLCLWNYTV